MGKWVVAIALVSTAAASWSFADDADALEKARALFPEFRESVYTDEEKARASFGSLVEISPLVQKRLLTWLDEEYAKQKAAYQNAKAGKLPRPISSKDNRAEIKQLRKELEDIRELEDESEMKKALEKTGWPALEKLLRLNQSNISSSLKKAEPDPKAVQVALERTEKIGRFRYELRKLMGYEVTTTEEDLHSQEKSDQAESIEMSSKAASVLRKNERMKGEIPLDEYKGILEINHWRIAAGMQPLVIDPKLCEAARDHSKDMAEHNFFAHESPIKGKTTPWDRARNFKTSANGENIAINDSTAAANLAWFYSPPHHQNLFNPEFSAVGLGVHGRHFTQLFRLIP